jgi:hypothetical protein
MGELDSFVGAVIKTISVNVTNNIVVSTPVDTGFAKASWIPTVGNPSSSTGGSRQGPSSGAQKAGLARVRGYTVKQGRVFIVNNVKYIGDLNSGSSAQAPAGFVQGGITRGISAAIKQAPRVIVSSR